MFTRKYIFETKNTRYHRYLKNSLLFLCFVAIFYLLFGLVIIKFSQSEQQETDRAYFKRTPDIIVVFTGDIGRIPYAMKLAKNYKISNILITGVYSKNTVASIIKKNNLQNYVNEDLLNLDYLARNTVENVIYTLRHLRKNPGLKNVLVVSHDYHIMRIKNIFNSLGDSSDTYEISYSGLKSRFDNYRSIKILYTEVFKLFRSYLFLLFWEQEIVPTA